MEFPMKKEKIYLKSVIIDREDIYNQILHFRGIDLIRSPSAQFHRILKDIHTLKNVGNLHKICCHLDLSEDEYKRNFSYLQSLNLQVPLKTLFKVSKDYFVKGYPQVIKKLEISADQCAIIVEMNGFIKFVEIIYFVPDTPAEILKIVRKVMKLTAPKDEYEDDFKKYYTQMDDKDVEEYLIADEERQREILFEIHVKRYFSK